MVLLDEFGAAVVCVCGVVLIEVGVWMRPLLLLTEASCIANFMRLSLSHTLFLSNLSCFFSMLHFQSTDRENGAKSSAVIGAIFCF